MYACFYPFIIYHQYHFRWTRKWRILYRYFSSFFFFCFSFLVFCFCLVCCLYNCVYRLNGLFTLNVWCVYRKNRASILSFSHFRFVCFFFFVSLSVQGEFNVDFLLGLIKRALILAQVSLLHNILRCMYLKKNGLLICHAYRSKVYKKKRFFCYKFI